MRMLYGHKENNMKRIASVLIFALWAVTAGAQLLWKISGNGLEYSSYIFGTHHAAPPSMTDEIDGFADAFDACTRVYGELLFESLSDPEVSMSMAREMMCPPDSTVSSLLAPEHYAVLDSVMRSMMGVGAKQLDMLKPAAISAQLAMLMAAKEFPGMKGEEQLDMAIQNRAKEKGKMTGALETVEFQSELLYGTPIIRQAEDLSESLEQLDEMPEVTREMAEAYRNKDLDRLLLITEREAGSDTDFMERTVYGRNRDWVEKMKDIMAEGSTFFAVGAAHLPGEKGVLALLRQAGYTVEPVE